VGEPFLILNLNLQLTPGNEGIGDEKDQEQSEAGHDTQALVGCLHRATSAEGAAYL
jgi:hypothetical protein